MRNLLSKTLFISLLLSAAAISSGVQAGWSASARKRLPKILNNPAAMEAFRSKLKLATTWRPGIEVPVIAGAGVGAVGGAVGAIALVGAIERVPVGAIVKEAVKAASVGAVGGAGAAVVLVGVRAMVRKLAKKDWRLKLAPVDMPDELKISGII